jgi:hypothetical protein
VEALSTKAPQMLYSLQELHVDRDWLAVARAVSAWTTKC